MRQVALGAALFSTVGAFALCSPAAAQDSGPSAAEEEIVVTATRREERLQDVPIAVTAVGAEQIENTGIRTLTDVQYVAPGIQFGSTPSDAGFRVRGAGVLGGFTSSSESPVGLVVDGVVVPFGKPVQNLGAVERIEVLQGPQGTQFGKNASSGVVSIVTRTPDTEDFFGDLYASHGELNETELRGSINVPMGGGAAFSLAAYTRSYDGYVYNAVRDEDWGGEEAYGFRGRFHWEMTPSFSASLIGDWVRTDLEGPEQLWTLNSVSPLGEPGFIPFLGGTDLAALGITPGYGSEASAEEYASDNGDEENYGASLELNYDIGEFTLTSISAIRRQEGEPGTYAIDGTSLARFQAQNYGSTREYLSQEFRLTSPSGGPLEYVAGVYFATNEGGGRGESAQLRPALPFSAFPVISITAGISSAETKTESAAVFTDGRYRFNDQYSLLFGARFTHDDVTASSVAVVDPLLPVFVIGNTGRPLQTGANSGDGWSGRLGFEYKPSDDLLFYATAARGYLGPTVTFSILTATRSDVEPQTVDDITVGFKSQWFNRRLTLNGNVFHDEYEDLQTGVFNGVEFLTSNAGGAETTGAQIEARWRASDALDFTLGYAYTDATYTDYVVDCPTYYVILGTEAANCTEPGGLYQASGDRLPNAPEHTFSSGANYEQPFGSGMMFDASANYYHRSESQFDVGDPNTEQPAYEIVNLNLGIGQEDGGWRLGLFARNVFNEYFATGIINLPFTTNPGTYVNWNTREGRRTVGVSIQAAF